MAWRTQGVALPAIFGPAYPDSETALLSWRLSSPECNENLDDPLNEFVKTNQALSLFLGDPHRESVHLCV